MDNDLSDVGLNALEALEAQDEQETSNQEDSGEEKDTSENLSTTNAGEEENETNTDVSSDEEDDNEADGSDKEQTAEDKEDENSELKKELSDEEFEELAKKRGYSKATTEEEKKQEEEKANQEKANLEKLTARPKEVDEDVWNELPEENKIIYNALPYINAVGARGTIKVKTPDQLPDDFTFASKKDEAKFYNELQAQEMKATQMANALESRRQRDEMAQSQKAEAREIISQIEALQKTGDLPTPKAKNGTKEFDNDPAVITINKVLGYRAEMAKRGVNLPIRESLLLYKAEHPEAFEKKEAKGDIERKNVAKKVAGNSKSTGTAINKDEDYKPQYYRAGMSTEDVLDRVLDDMD